MKAEHSTEIKTESKLLKVKKVKKVKSKSFCIEERMYLTSVTRCISFTFVHPYLTVLFRKTLKQAPQIPFPHSRLVMLQIIGGRNVRGSDTCFHSMDISGIIKPLLQLLRLVYLYSQHLNLPIEANLFSPFRIPLSIAHRMNTEYLQQYTHLTHYINTFVLMTKKKVQNIQYEHT